MPAKLHKGFTLLELLVTISIIAILTSIVVFSSQQVRSQARDERRKADLAVMQGGLEQQFTDCGSYYSTDSFNNKLPGGVQHGEPMTGGYRSAPCYVENIYIEEFPQDPLYPERNYRYDSEGPAPALPWRPLTDAGDCPRAIRSGTTCSKTSCNETPDAQCYLRHYYILCAALENPPTTPADPDYLNVCNSKGGCGNVPCNYVITSPNQPQ